MYARILVPIDGSACSDEGAKEAVALAEGLGSAVVFLFVMDTLSTRKEGVVNMSEALEALTAQGRVLLDNAGRMAASAGVRSAGDLVEGTPVDAIVRRSADFDLVVMGSHGRGIFRRLAVGSVTQDVMQRIVLPMLIVRCDAEGGRISKHPAP
jgi:nucleotide-binding universal stress UspA family protein